MTAPRIFPGDCIRHSVMAELLLDCWDPWGALVGDIVACAERVGVFPHGTLTAATDPIRDMCTWSLELTPTDWP